MKKQKNQPSRSYSVDPVQQKGSIENYRAIKDKVQKAKPTDLPNGQQMNTPSPRQQSQKGFRFEKKLPTQVNFTFFYLF